MLPAVTRENFVMVALVLCILGIFYLYNEIKTIKKMPVRPDVPVVALVDDTPVPPKPPAPAPAPATPVVEEKPEDILTVKQ
jgi:hypothetical protein